MARKNINVKSLREKEVELNQKKRKKQVELVSNDNDDKNLMKYIKPVLEYKTLKKRSKDRPYFLRRCLYYIIQAKKKKKSNSEGTIIFNYMDGRNKILKAEVVQKFSCTFCLMLCGGLEGLRLHLKSSHDVFEYKFYRAEEDHGPEVDVSLKPDAIIFGVEETDVDNHQWSPFTFCSKRCKQRQRDESNNMKRLHVRILELDLNELTLDTEKESPNVNNDNVSSPPKAHSSEKASEILTTTQPETAQSSEPEVPLVSRRKKLLAERAKARGLERLKSRQFYHSQTMQPMTFEQVMSDEDSENEDDDALDFKERLKLERIVDASKEEKQYMYLWNTFVRRQRVLADGHVPWACEEFSKLHKEELKGYTFNWWWRLFLLKLWDHGLVCAKTIDKCNTIILENSDEAEPSTSQGAANANTQQPMEVDGKQQ